MKIKPLKDETLMRSTRLFGQFLAAVGLLMGSALTLPAFANLIIVDTVADEFSATISGDQGCSLREAVYAANQGVAYGSCGAGSSGADIIILPAGDYYLSIAKGAGTDPGAAEGDLDITGELTIFGGVGQPRIISSIFDRVFDIAEGAGAVSLQNLQIRDGLPAECGGGIRTIASVALELAVVELRSNHAQNGGGICVQVGQPVADPVLDLTDVLFFNNTALAAGGGIQNTTGVVSSAVCLRCTFEQNQAAVGGAVLISNLARMTFTDSTFDGNSVTSGSSGGAISSTHSAWVTLNNTVVENNTSADATSSNDGYQGSESSALFVNGGVVRNSLELLNSSELNAVGTRFESNTGPAIRAKGASVLLDNVVVTGTERYQGGGYALDVEDNTTLVTNSVFEDNDGAIRCVDCDLTVIDASFVGNVRDEFSPRGGAVRSSGMTSELSFDNVTFSGNSAAQEGAGRGGRGGAIFLEEGTAFRFNNVTIAGNSSEVDGGGIDAADADVAPEVSNSILAGNTVGAGLNDCAGVVASLGWNLLGVANGCSITATAGDQFGTLVSPIDPLLGSLQWIDGYPVHGLLAGSPALDAGNPATPTNVGSSCRTLDQLGTPRPVDGGGGAFCDIGAIEEESPNVELIFADGFESGGGEFVELCSFEVETEKNMCGL